MNFFRYNNKIALVDVETKVHQMGEAIYQA